MLQPVCLQVKMHDGVCFCAHTHACVHMYKVILCRQRAERAHQGFARPGKSNALNNRVGERKGAAIINWSSLHNQMCAQREALCHLHWHLSLSAKIALT